MGLFDLFKKKENTATPVSEERSDLLLAMPMFNNGETFDAGKVVEHLKNHWKIEAELDGEKEGSCMLTISGEIIMLATLGAQIPWGDIQGSAQYAYNWNTAEKDLENHDSHVLVTIMSQATSKVERFGILTKVLASIMSTSNAIGVYQGSQSLLIPRNQYIESAESLKEGRIPVDIWVYTGLRKGERGNSIYTYGLSYFGKAELEVIDSSLGLEELYGFIANITAYIIKSDVTLKHGETLGYTADQKIKITKSKGIFTEGETLKLEM